MSSSIVHVEYDTATQDLRAVWTAQELLTTFRDDRGLGAVTLRGQRNADDDNADNNNTATLFAVSVYDEARGASPPLPSNTNVSNIILWDYPIMDTTFPQMKVLKQRVRDIISPERSLGHSDVNDDNDDDEQQQTKKETSKVQVLDLSRRNETTTTPVDTTLQPTQVCLTGSNTAAQFLAPHLTITYCTGCNWLLRATYLAQEYLRQQHSTAAVTLIPCRPPAKGGTFRVTIATTKHHDTPQLVWDRSIEGRFPETDELLERIAQLSAANSTDNDDDNDNPATTPFDEMDDDEAEEARRFFGVMCQLEPPIRQPSLPHRQQGPDLSMLVTAVSRITNGLKILFTNQRAVVRHIITVQGSLAMLLLIVGLGWLPLRAFAEEGQALLPPATSSIVTTVTSSPVPVAPSPLPPQPASETLPPVTTNGMPPPTMTTTQPSPTQPLPPSSTPTPESSSPAAFSDNEIKEQIKDAIAEMLTTNKEEKQLLLQETEDTAIKKEIKEIIIEMMKEEKEETQTDDETNDLVQRLEEQKQKGKAPTPAEEAETKNIIVQIEKDEEKMEQETAKLIERVEKLNEAAEKAEEPLLPEPQALNRQEASKASAEETNQFLSFLKERLKVDKDFVKYLDYQQKTIIAPDMDAEKILNIFKGRAEASKEFKAMFDAFLSKLMEAVS